MPKLTHERLKEMLDYSPETGIFAWRKSSSPRVAVGSRAGVVSGNGRRYIAVDGEKFMAHRLAWFYKTGEWPDADVKQVDGDFDNCAFSNLESVSRSIASRSRALDGRNKTGYRGVSLDDKGRYQAFITREYKQIWLGVFDTAEEASAAYEQAASELELASFDDEKAIQAEKSAVRRRLRVAWRSLNKHSFANYDEFVAAVKDVPARHSVVAADKNELVSPSNFLIVADLSTGFDLSTREGRIAYSRAHRVANPNTYRERDLRKNFNIGLKEYEEMLDAQNGVCDICKKPETIVVRGKVAPLSVDHDHSDGRVRGLLCAHCNHAIGKFSDDVALLESAIAYLKKHAAPKPFVCDNPRRDWLIVSTPGFSPN